MAIMHQMAFSTTPAYILKVGTQLQTMKYLEMNTELARQDWSQLLSQISGR